MYEVWLAGALLDYLIGSQQERRRNRQPEHLRGLEVDHQLKLGGLLDREFSGLSALQDLVHVASYTSDRIQVVPP